MLARRRASEEAAGAQHPMGLGDDLRLGAVGLHRQHGLADDGVGRRLVESGGGGIGLDDTSLAADRLRGECDIYVDNKLAQFEDYLNGTLRSVSRGRHQLRTAAGTHDYVQH